MVTWAFLYKAESEWSMGSRQALLAESGQLNFGPDDCGGACHGDQAEECPSCAKLSTLAEGHWEEDVSQGEAGRTRLGLDRALFSPSMTGRCYFTE